MLGVGRLGPLAPVDVAPAAENAALGSRPGSAGDLSEVECWAVLASVEGVGPATLGRLLRRYGSGATALEIARSRDAVAALTVPAGAEEALDVVVARAVITAARRAAEIVQGIRARGLQIMIVDDPGYPARLRATELPPPVLFIRGSATALCPERAVAVVGTRRPTEAGRRIAARIGAAVCRAGATVVSGLAVGVDGAAHAAVVTEGGPTVGVLGGGHARIFPRAHARLADAIVDAGGAIISEHPPDSPPTRWSFPRRNRVISGLADATVVVEAGPRSGALITAAWALEQGRECFIVPGSIEARESEGCLAFLRDNHGLARIVAAVPDLVSDLGLPGGAGVPGDGLAGAGSSAGVGSARALLADLGASERLVAVALVAGDTTVDDLVAATDLPVASVLGCLTMLEMRGLVVDAMGRYRPIGRLAGTPAGESRRARRAGAR